MEKFPNDIKLKTNKKKCMERKKKQRAVQRELIKTERKNIYEKIIKGIDLALDEIRFIFSEQLKTKYIKKIIIDLSKRFTGIQFYQTYRDSADNKFVDLNYENPECAREYRIIFKNYDDSDSDSSSDAN